MIGWAQNWLMPDRHWTTKTTFAVGFANAIQRSIKLGPVCLTHTTRKCQAKKPQLGISDDQLVDKVWVPVTNEMGLYMRVWSLPNFLAVTASGEVTEVGHHELTKCAMVWSVWLCLFLRWALKASCAVTIYKDDERGHVYEQCKFTVKERRLPQPVVLFTE